MLGALEIGEPGFVVGRERAQAVELGVVTGADEIAIGEVGRQFVSESGDEQLAERREFLELCADRGQRGRRAEGRERRAELGQLQERVADAAEFAGIAETILQPAEDARDVADVAEAFAQGRERSGLSEEFTDELLAAMDLRELQRRRGEPTLEEACASRGRGAVDRGEE